MKGEKQNMNKFITKLAKIFLGLSMAAGVGVAVGASKTGAGRVDAAAGDVLKTYDTNSSTFETGYARQSGDNFVWWGQKNYFGANNATNHGNFKPTAADLPVVKAQNASAATNTTGLYYCYTSEAVANVGSISIELSAKSGSSTVNAYVVTSSTAASSGSTTWTKVTLSASSTSAQGDNVASADTYRFTFNATETNAKYYGFVFTTSSYWRATGFKMKLFEGATGGSGGGGSTTYTVTYDGNKPASASGDVSGVPSPVSGISGSYTPTSSVPTLDDYVCIGWNTNPAATTALSAVTVNAATTLYAIWFYGYVTGFESSESFTVPSSPSYNSSSETSFGPSGSQWKTVYGSASKDSVISGSQVMQMRLYSSGSFGYTYSAFVTQNVKSVSFDYKVSNTNVKMDVWYCSTNNATPTWTQLGSTITLNNTNKQTFSHTFTPVLSYFRIKIGISSSSTRPSSSNYKFTIDNVKFEKASASAKVVEFSKTFGSKVMLAKNNAQRTVSGLSAASQNITNPVYKWEILNPSAANIAEISGTGSTPTFTIKAAGTLTIKVSARASADSDIDANYTACTSNISLQIVNYGGSFSWTNRGNMIFKEGAGFDVSPTTISLTLNDDTVVNYNNDYSGLDIYMGTAADNVALVTQETIASITSSSQVNNKYYKLYDPTYEIGSSATQVTSITFNAKASISLASVGNVTQITKNQTIYLIPTITEGWGGSVTYTSSNSSIASVDSNGVIKSGNSSSEDDITITATLENGNTATFTMNVLESKTYTVEEAYDMVSGFNTAEADMYYGSDTAGDETETYTVSGYYYFHDDDDDQYDYVCICDDPSDPNKILRLYNCTGSDDTAEGEILTVTGYLNDYMHGGNYYLCDGEVISHEPVAGDKTVDLENTTVTPQSGTTTYSFGATFTHPGSIHIAYTDGFSRDTSLSSASVTGASMITLGTQTVSVYVNDVLYSGNDNLLVGTYSINVTNVGASFVIPGFSKEGTGFTQSLNNHTGAGWGTNGAGSDYSSSDHSPYLLKMDGNGDYIEYVFADGETNYASSYTCSVSLKKIGGNGQSSFNLIGVDSSGNPIDGVTGSTTSASGAQNAITTVSGTLSNSTNESLYSIRFVFVKASSGNVGVSGATITAPDETNTELINAQDDAMAVYLSQFKTCPSGWSSRNDVVILVTEYNAMHSTAKTAFNSQTITDYDWTEAGEYNISTHTYTGGSKSLNGVSAIDKLKTMVDAYNRSLQQGESTLTLQTPGENFTTLNSFNISLLFGNKSTNSVAIIVIISMVSMTAIGGFFFLRKRKENN